MNGFISNTSGNVGAFYNQPSQPSASDVGDLWYDSLNGIFKQWDGNAWNVIYLPNANNGNNAIINGNFDIWQRGTSIAVTATTHVSDRWRCGLTSTGLVTISQDTSVPTYAQSGVVSSYSMKVLTTTADASIATGDNYTINQFIEGYNVRQLAQKPFTISFWVKDTKTGIHAITFRTTGAEYSYVTEYSVTNANTWEKKIITVPAAPITSSQTYTTGIGLYVTWGLMAGTTFQTPAPSTWVLGNYLATANSVNSVDAINNAFYLSQVQLETGSIATPFKERTYLQELALCQRYCWVPTSDSPVADITQSVFGTGRFQSTSVCGILMPFPVQMRIAPTLTTSNVAHFNIDDGTSATAATIITLTAANTSKYTGFLSVTGTGAPYAAKTPALFYRAQAAGQLFFDAEF